MIVFPVGKGRGSKGAEQQEVVMGENRGACSFLWAAGLMIHVRHSK